MMRDFILFGIGILVGCIVSLLLLLLSLSNFKMERSKSKPDESSTEQDILHERQPTDDERSQIANAISYLKGLDSENSNSTTSHPSEEAAPSDLKDMEKEFCEFAKEAKDRQKNIKGFCIYLSDVSRSYAGFSKELLKHSQIAESFISTEKCPDMYYDGWWNALSIAYDHLSQDQNYLSSEIYNLLYHNMTRVEQEHSHIEKQLYNEGLKFITKLKESQSLYESKFKEVEKFKRDMGINVSATSLTTFSGSTTVSSASCVSPSSSTSMTHLSGGGDGNRNFIRLQLYENTLRETCEKFAVIQQEINEKIPRILHDYKLLKANVSSSISELLTQFAELLNNNTSKSNQINHRLKMDLVSIAMKKAGSHSTQYHPVMLQLLETISSNGPKIAGENIGSLDMTLESSAGLAASLMSQFPSLPMQIRNAIGKETCVWFNALCGRIYRDAARSDWFNTFFCKKSAQMLNKGKRPSYIDEYKVSNVKFGSIPPLLRNIQWVPISSKSSSSSCGGVLGASEGDPEYDIAIEADMSFRSGLSFTVDTKVWLNWPRQRCAFIPVSINLEVAEMCGKIRFGVNKHNSFFSFVGEPSTRFIVHSEVGSQYKLKNIPQLSTVIIKKIKSYIRNKVLFPKTHKFRLIWPKNWWPVLAPGEKLPFTETKVMTDQVGSSTVSEGGTSNPNDVTDENKSIKKSVDPMNVSTGANTSQSISPSMDASTPTSGFSPFSNITRWFASSPSLSTTGDAVSSATSTSSTPTQDTCVEDGIIDTEDMEANEDDCADDSNVNDLVDRLQKGMPSSQPSSGEKKKTKNAILKHDHVREYVSHLMNSAASMSRVNVTNHSVDDILVRDKTYVEDSIAIVRGRCHSIADFRHSTLDTLWGEFLGSIGHDFSLLSDDSDPSPKSINVKSKSASNSKTSHQTQQESKNSKFGIRGIIRSLFQTKIGTNSARNLVQDQIKNTSHNRSLDIVGGSSQNPSQLGKHRTKSSNDNISASSKDVKSFEPLALMSKSDNVTNKQPSTPSCVATMEAPSVNTPPPPPAQSRDGTFSLTKKLSLIQQTLKSGISSQVEEQTNRQNRLTRGNSFDNSECGNEPKWGMKPIHTTLNSGETKHITSSSQSHTSLHQSRTSISSIPVLHIPTVPTVTNRSTEIIVDKQKQLVHKPQPQLIQTYVPGNWIPNHGNVDDKRAFELEQEAMNLAWQAHAESMALAAARGEYQCMQSFVRTPKKTSNKVWAVLKNGILRLYGNSGDNHGVVEKGNAVAKYSLSGCACRPLEQALGFEINLSLTSPTNTNRNKGSLSLQFWTETDIQCRSWVMAVQHSSILPDTSTPPPSPMQGRGVTS